MLKFLATTENIKKKQDQNDRIIIAGKWSNLAAENCYSQFPILNLKRVELFYS